MKKCLSMLCAVALLLGLMIPVSAAEHNIKISASNHTVKPGDTLFVQIGISGVDEDDVSFAMNWLSMKIEYDSTVFDFGADLNGDGEIADYRDGRNTIVETTSRATATNDPWKSMTPIPAIGMADADNVAIGFDAGATPQFNSGKTTATFNTLGAYAYTNGALMGFYLTVKDNAAAGDYSIKLTSGVAEGRAPLRFTEKNQDDVAIPVTFVNGKITVQAATPTVTAKTATISSVTGGYVYATATAWDGTTSVDLENLATTVTTAGTAADEKVYFYFVPKAGYTANITATKNGESFAITNGSTSKEDTLSANATYTFSFAPVAAGTPVASSIQVINPSADGVTIFGKATGATAFGALVGVSDNVAVNAGHTFAADSANADGEFAIELSGSAIFSADKTYAAKIFATNGATTVYSSSAAISY